MLDANENAAGVIPQWVDIISPPIEDIGVEYTVLSIPLVLFLVLVYVLIYNTQFRAILRLLSLRCLVIFSRKDNRNLARIIGSQLRRGLQCHNLQNYSLFQRNQGWGVFLQQVYAFSYGPITSNAHNSKLIAKAIYWLFLAWHQQSMINFERRTRP
ncbi:MAG: hypothetical protein OEZ68_16030 [Gammaproteobacteria bacterium]|nr:hypothetical protein [Gammaproteobacteria bacterium]MDH5802311.1 hypothetical protein [Gammaproteobacteria bacterium]